MPKLQKPQPDILKGQRIDESGPGTILKDFQTLLDFVGTGGIKTGGKNYRLPLAALGDLDERMTYPLRPMLNRPQQLSYPHLNGLYLLFRASGLGVSSGQGESGRLSVSPKRLEQWSALNSEEQYFTLLHCMFTTGWGPIDSGRSSGRGPWDDLQWSFRGRTPGGFPVTKSGTRASDHFYSWTLQTTAALLELFGILVIPRVAQHDGENWRIAAIRRTDFGSAILDRLLDAVDLYFEVCRLARGQTDGKKKWLGEFFGDCFPNCRNTLAEVEDEFVDGLWQFKVSLGTVWRRIIIPADSNADELVVAVLTGFKFDFDHLYELQLRDRSGRNITIGHPDLDEPDYDTEEFAIGSLPLNPGQSMTLLYDFGDSWRFKVKLEKILAGNRRITKARIAEKKGKAPTQSNDSDDEW